jgi:GDSL-like Lipase/Acylhydrolase family
MALRGQVARGRLRAMKRTIPWIIAVVALIAFAASFSEMHKARDRYWELANLRSHDHMHREVREFIIRAALEGLDHPIVVIGDSITEMARLPEMIGDTPLVNAGIGGSTVEDFEIIAPRLFANSNPSMIVVALGTNNDAGAIGQDYGTLLSTLKKFAPKVLAVAVTKQDGVDLKNTEIEAAATQEGIPFIGVALPEGSNLPDNLHLNSSGYKKWIPALVAAISGHIS